MSNSRVCVVQEKLCQIKEFLELHKPLVNAHMTSYITENRWVILPEAIHEEACSLSSKEIYELFWAWGSDPQNFRRTTAIGKLLMDCWNFSLDSKNFEDIKISHEETGKCEGSAKFLSPKKIHEVGNLKEVVANLCVRSEADCVVDVGGGKGYLGSSLVREKKISVLSIDFKSSNTTGADTIFKKTEKAACAQDVNSVYKQITAYVTPESDLQAFARKHLGNSSRHKICLTGLHTCGDLASTCIKLFCKSPDTSSMCCIGCCYNLLTEMFESQQAPDQSLDMYGFPMSDYLKNEHYSLGRNARMIACQSIDRICHEKKVMNPSLFWRAVLQVHLKRQLGAKCDVSVGRHCSKAKNLPDYLWKAEKSLKTNLQLSDGKINSLVAETQEFSEGMAKFYLFRLAFAPVVETLLILDKLLYLHEQGVENAYVCKVFDGVKSPRRYGIIAVKAPDILAAGL